MMQCPLRVSPVRLLPAFLILLAGVVVASARDETPTAAEALAVARRAYREHDLAAAEKHYRDFLHRFADSVEAPAAKVELARCLLERAEPDPGAARDLLVPLVDEPDLSVRPAVLFWLGAAERRRASKPRAEGSAEAARRFAAAADAYAAGAKQNKSDREWMLCARAARADALLRGGSPQEARAAAAELLKDEELPAAVKGFALLIHGAACVTLKDDLAAGRSLNQLAPFQDEIVGPAARRLLARIHERADERAEALALYEAEIADYKTAKTDAENRLKAEADALEKDPPEKARLTALVQGPAPEHVLQAAFAAGVLHFEAGRFEDARARFAEAAASSGRWLPGDARLYQACSEVRAGQFDQAVKLLAPRPDRDGNLGAQERLWLGRARVGAADPDDEEAKTKALDKALADFTAAADGFGKPPFTDGPLADFARTRRAEALLDAGDVLERLGRFKDAAETCARARAEKAGAALEAVALQRESADWTLAGDYETPEQLADQFERDFPHSMLRPEVLLRRAEAAGLTAQRARPTPAATFAAEAERCYRALLSKYPEFERASQARYGLAWVLYRSGEYEKARALLDDVPTGDRKDELAGVPCLLADCLIRTAPTKADDAVAAGKLQEQLTQAAELLDQAVAATPEAPFATDALMRLGVCQLRLRELAAQDEERNRLAGASRAAFERVLLEHPLDPLQPHAAFERARWIAKGGDVNEAVQRTRLFGFGSLRKHPLAPLACVQLAGWMRTQDGKAADAAKLLARVRRDRERDLARDPARAEWAPLLRYQHALALNDAGKFEESRQVLSQILETTPDRPEAFEAKLVWGQGLLAEARQKLDAAAQQLATPELPPAEAAAARRAQDVARKGIETAADYLESAARKLRDKSSSPILKARLFYEAAWVHRGRGDEEVAAERTRRQEEWRKDHPKPPEGQPAPEPPAVPLAEIPLQPSEKRGRDLYAAAASAAGDAELPLAAQVRLELAELHAQRGDNAEAVSLLKGALDQEPPPDLAGRIGMRLAAVLATKGDKPGAIKQLERVAALTDNSWAPHARYRLGATLAQAGEWDKAVEMLAPFQTVEALQNLGGLADASLVLIGQAHTEKSRWDKSAEAYAALLERFADSGWRRHAHFSQAAALQRDKKFAEAVEEYKHAVADAPPEVAVRSLLQTAACQAELKQYEEALETLKGVGADLPDLHALSLLETGYAHVQLDKLEDAETCWKQVVSDYPKSSLAEAAKKRLEQKEARRTPPHALPEAERLLTLPVQPPEPLAAMGEYQPSDQSVFEGLLEKACQEAIVGPPPAVRYVASPPLHLKPPEPYEFRNAVWVRSLADLDALPPPGPLPVPKP
jgi:tetratricopeptide (TPR) repeat protein